MTAMQAMQNSTFTKLHSAENSHFWLAMQAMQNDLSTQHSKNRRKPRYAAMQAMHPLKGVNWALHSCPSLPLGANLNSQKRGGLKLVGGEL